MKINNFFTENSFYLMLLVLSMLAISFGSVGSGFFNNYNITVYLSYFILIIFFVSRDDILKYFRGTYFLKIFSVLVVFLLSSILAAERGAFDVWDRYFSILVCILFGCIFYFLINEDKVNPDFVIYMLTILGVIHVLFLLLFSARLDDPANYDWAQKLPFFNNIRNFTDYLVICFLCSIYLYLINDKKKYFFTSVIILSCLFWSGSRSSILAGFFSLIFIIYFFRNNFRSLIYLSCVPVFSYLLSVLFRVNSSGLGFYNSISRSVSGDVNKISSSRIDVYKQVIDLIKERPIFGYGGEAVRNQGVMAGDMKLAQAHNFILQILLEFGFVGLFFVVLVFFSIFSKINLSNINNKNCIFYAVVINIFISSFFNGGFYYTATLSLFCLFCACVCYLNINNGAINAR